MGKSKSGHRFEFTASDIVKRYRVPPAARVRLDKWDPDDDALFAGGKKKAKSLIPDLSRQLGELQELLWAEHRRRILVVLQGMDTAGKDGTIRHVFGAVNPQGCRVANFKQPTSRELARDYLWRIHDRVPTDGMITIFNRSHYEDVLIVRVHDLAPPAVWRKRYEHINAFEKMLADEGTTIVKFYLHINRDEQKERLQARLDRADKRWKFNKGDLTERALWPKYQEAYEAALSRTSTKHAPWFIVPANRKWYRNLVVARILIHTLKGLKMKWPQPEDGLDDVVIE
jgi:PPK2 family polyphosphate:nucleotide phosphotransferase